MVVTKRKVTSRGLVFEWCPHTNSWTRLEAERNLDAEAGPNEGLLALSWKKFDLDWEQGLPIRTSKVRIVPFSRRGAPDQEFGDTGTSGVWDGAVVLGKALENIAASCLSGSKCNLAGYEALHVTNKTVLELGGGSGFLGSVLSVLGARAIVTDLLYSLDMARQTAELNDTPFETYELDWFAPDVSRFIGSLDLVVASDVVWLDLLVKPLVNTVEQLAQGMKVPNVLVCHQTRSRGVDQLFLEDLRRRGFSVKMVDHLKADGFEGGEDIHLFWITWTKENHGVQL